jgi:fumarylacetoacetate (FAA) hydrolase
MQLATLRDGTPDGQLVVISRDLRRAVPASEIAGSLRAAWEIWQQSEARLRALSDELNRGVVEGGLDFGRADVAAPLPRTWQWLDASASTVTGS